MLVGRSDEAEKMDAFGGFGDAAKGDGGDAFGADFGDFEDSEAAAGAGGAGGFCLASDFALGLPNLSSAVVPDPGLKSFPEVADPNPFGSVSEASPLSASSGLFRGHDHEYRGHGLQPSPFRANLSQSVSRETDATRSAENGLADYWDAKQTRKEPFERIPAGTLPNGGLSSEGLQGSVTQTGGLLDDSMSSGPERRPAGAGQVAECTEERNKAMIMLVALCCDELRGAAALLQVGNAEIYIPSPEPSSLRRLTALLKPPPQTPNPGPEP